MRSLKEFIIKEGFLRKNLGLGKDVLIKKWLDEYKIINYTINKDLTINVKGCVYLKGFTDKKLPDYIQFRKVTKYFYIACCPKLESLEGCPEKVGGDFSCYGCRNLTSLEGAPKEVGGDFYCRDCDSLTSLEGVPKEVGGDFSCYSCRNLTSLEGAPKDVGGNFICSECSNLTSLEGAPKQVGSSFYCNNCKNSFTKDDVKKYCEVGWEIFT